MGAEPILYLILGLLCLSTISLGIAAVIVADKLTRCEARVTELSVRLLKLLSEPEHSTTKK